jgi:hypothetical protein
MEKIREYLRNPFVAAAIGFVVGLIIGLPLLGWGLWPVKWTDAAAKDLRPDLKNQYICMIIDSYNLNKDNAIARARLDTVGISADQALQGLTGFNVTECHFKSPTALQDFLTGITSNAVPLPGGTAAGTVAPQTSNNGTPAPLETLPIGIATETPSSSGSSFPVILLLVLCVLVLLVGAALVYVLFLRNRRPGGGGPSTAPAMRAQAASREATHTDYQSSEGVEPPLAQFMTTYMQGDDLYDDSFSIDSGAGDFLGECGVGISDTIGVGNPKKVTAFEVWLFDKNDIQTVTKVLMSEHAYNDPAIRQRLASKGEPILVEHDQRVLLETATLQLEARIVELDYAAGALPQNSNFKQLTLELAVWQK